jgi:arylsulfatase A-like enzyme
MATTTEGPSEERAMKRLVSLFFCGLLMFVGGTVVGGAERSRWNVLFIASDDMRPQLGCYGDKLVKSPHLDRLAARGLIFDRAFCQQALCSPSRISLLTGRHPWTTRIYQIGPFLRETMPDVVTLPQHFKNQGYFTRSLGKVYHVGIDDPVSWTVPPWHSKKPRYGPVGTAAVEGRRAALLAANQPIPTQGENAPFYGGPAFESPDLADDDLLDGDTVREALNAMRELAQHPEQPFFLAVGFANPHVPWVAPKRYWDLYRDEDMPLPENRFAPRNAPAFAATSGADFYWYGNVPKDRNITPEFGRKCLHGYLAAISYVDAGVGRLLDELDKLNLRDNTMIVFWGDHGYYMGEHNWWGSKHNNYEGATRAPLIVSVPKQATAGHRCSGLVEFVDIYPSLVELCGLPQPADAAGLEGKSFAPLLADPRLPWKAAAFSEYPKGGNQGVAMRTDRYRYVRWCDKTSQVVAEELYDHQTDPAENENVAQLPEHRGLLQQLATQMSAHVRPTAPRSDKSKQPRQRKRQ